MDQFTKDWIRNSLKWLGVSVGLLVGVSLLIAFSHGIAWIGQRYGGLSVLCLIAIIMGIIVVIGSGIQTRNAHKTDPS